MSDTYACPDEAAADEQTAVERAMEVDADSRLQFLREAGRGHNGDFERVQLRNAVAARLEPFVTVARMSDAGSEEIAEGLAVVAMAVFDTVREENLRLRDQAHRAHNFLGEVSLELLDVGPENAHVLEKIRALKTRVDPAEHRRVDRLYSAQVRASNMLADVVDSLAAAAGEETEQRPRPAMDQRYSIGYGHLLERRADDVCTCDGGQDPAPGIHREWCGWEPVVALDDLPGLLAYHHREKAPAGPIRPGTKVRRHLYCGPGNDDEIAVTVGPHDRAWSLFLADAANAYIAAGFMPPVTLPAPERSPSHELDVAEAALVVEVPAVAEAIPDIRPAVEPNGCRWCGIGQRAHAQQWIEPVGWHKWGAPSDAQRLARMKARREATLARRAGAGCPCCRTFGDPAEAGGVCVHGVDAGGCGHPVTAHAARARVTVGTSAAAPAEVVTAPVLSPEITARIEAAVALFGEQLLADPDDEVPPGEPVNTMVRDAAAGIGEKMPCAITVYCDVCATEHSGDYVVTEDMPGPERLAIARKHLVDAEAWDCGPDGDFCPACKKTPPAAALPAEVPAGWPTAEQVDPDDATVATTVFAAIAETLPELEATGGQG